VSDITELRLLVATQERPATYMQLALRRKNYRRVLLISQMVCTIIEVVIKTVTESSTRPLTLRSVDGGQAGAHRPRQTVMCLHRVTDSAAAFRRTTAVQSVTDPPATDRRRLFGTQSIHESTRPTAAACAARARSSEAAGSTQYTAL